MKTIARFTLIALAMTLSVSFAASPPKNWDFTGPSNLPDNKPDILWRRKSNVDCNAWEMNGSSYVRGQWFGNTPDVNWKVVGCADFNQDGKLDILWRHEVSGLVFVWYMNGSMWLSTHQISATPLGSNWRIVGAADFGRMTNGLPSNTRDDWPDILWQETTTNQKVVWLMTGLTFAGSATIEGSTDWKAVAVDDFGISATNTTKDSKPDIVLANLTTGQLAIRYMDGLSTASQPMVTFSNGTLFYITPDLDKQIVGASDWVATDGFSDLLGRHVTDGRGFFWQMQGKTFIQEYYFPQQLHQWDPDWRMGTQELADSTWRLNPPPAAIGYVGAVASATGITLQIIDYPLNGQHFRIQRSVESAPALGLTS